jgi:hypothetical protein
LAVVQSASSGTRKIFRGMGKIEAWFMAVRLVRAKFIKVS